ncbi:MAG TPA: hypothetical protein VEW71_06975 [Allosphingosinicella sp.]|nr:hypothetical protein [Allosphingosinicella sp.]
MKPSRKLNRGSFVMQVSGGNPSGGGALAALAGKGKGGFAGDHDLGQPTGKSGGAGDADSDQGPEAAR